MLKSAPVKADHEPVTTVTLRTGYDQHLLTAVDLAALDIECL
jgi:hypothetical protein